MSRITLSLHKKTLRLSLHGGACRQSLNFDAVFPKRERLITHDGIEIKTGSVTFVLSGAFQNTDLRFFGAERDRDTDVVNPPCLAFYAEVTPEVFDLIRDSSLDSALVLTIATPLMGAIRFNSPLGEEKVWDTSKQNPIPVEGFDVDIEQAQEAAKQKDKWE